MTREIVKKDGDAPAEIIDVRDLSQESQENPLVASGRVRRVDHGLIDRRGWESGPWEGEPDLVAWGAHGFACLILRTDMGNLCGYVGIPDGHPWYRVGDGELDAQAHGGVTFTNHDNFSDEKVGGSGLWWIGFDCAHFNDVVPRMFAITAATFAMRDIATYKDIDYVTRETEALAQQARRAAEEAGR